MNWKRCRLVGVVHIKGIFSELFLLSLGEVAGFKFRICSSCQRLMNLRKKRLENAIDHFLAAMAG